MANILHAIQIVGALKEVYSIPFEDYQVIINALDYGFKIHCCARSLMATEILDGQDFDAACEIINGSVGENAIESLVGFVKSYDRHGVSDCLLNRGEPYAETILFGGEKNDD